MESNVFNGSWVLEGCCGQDYVVVIYLLICLWSLTLDIYYAYDLWLYEFDLHPGQGVLELLQLYLIKVLSGTCDWFGSYLRRDIGFVSYLRQVTVGFFRVLIKFVSHNFISSTPYQWWDWHFGSEKAVIASVDVNLLLYGQGQNTVKPV